MQVAHHNDHITHAVIGGKQAIEFGISNSAEFFNILSSTLYKDQILAVVREVLCNAWDAHIEAGCTDRAVQVTLTQDEFTIKDFGKGIHQDDMGLIYGTYGNSTKKNDGNQTGGFGLGCKAPFAYTDHFEVVSCHDGIRTIYNLSKSSAQAMGKPGITPIASFPTDESGLTVRIRIKGTDYRRFNELVTRIAYNGDMNIHLNGEQLATLDFDTSKGNFLLTRKTLLDAKYRIMVRYGNVVYPVDSGNLYGVTEIISHLDKLRGVDHQFAILFQAPPHSIAVTPSRESLSMQEHTINTLNTLFKGFLGSLDKEFTEACTLKTKEIIQQAVTTKRIDELLKREESLPVLNQKENIQVISDFNTMAQAYLQCNYPRGLDYRKADITNRLEAMVQNNLLDRGKVSSFLRELKQVKKECTHHRAWNVSSEKTTWLQRRVLAPLMRKLSGAGLSTQQLYSCGSEDHNYQSSKREGVPPLVPASQTNPHHLLTTLPYLRNIVVISTRKQDLVTRAYQHAVFKAAGYYQGYLVYLATRKKGEVAAVRDFFTKEGMVVVDLTAVEASEAEERRPATPRKPAKQGIVKLSSILRGNTINTQRIQQEDAERIDDPEFVIQVSLRNSIYSFEDWCSATSPILVQLFGQRGGITNSVSTLTKWADKGAVPFNTYVLDKVCSYILNNPRIESNFAQHLNRFPDINRKHESMIKMACTNTALSQEFGLGCTLTDEDKQYLTLWNWISRPYSGFQSNKQVKETVEWIRNIPVFPAMDALHQKLKKDLLQFVDTNELGYALKHGKPDEIDQAVSFYKSLINP